MHVFKQLERLSEKMIEQPLTLLSNDPLYDLLCSNPENLPTIASALKDYLEEQPNTRVKDVLGAYTAALAASNLKVFSQEIHGKFWHDKASELREIVANVHIADRQIESWWQGYTIGQGQAVITQHLFPAVQGREILFKSDLPPGTKLAPFVTRLLYSMALDDPTYLQDDVVIGKAIDPLSASALTSAILEMQQPWIVVPSDAKFRSAERSLFAIDADIDRRVTGLFVLLTVIEADWRVALDPRIGSGRQVEYWHRITGNRFKGVAWQDLPVDNRVRVFMQQWLGLARHTALRSSARYA